MSNERIYSKIADHLSQRIENGELSNEEMVQLIKLIGGYLNLRTIPEYAKENNLSYTGVKKFRTIKTIFNTNFVIDNL